MNFGSHVRSWILEVGWGWESLGAKLLAQDSTYLYVTNFVGLLPFHVLMVDRISIHTLICIPYLLLILVGRISGHRYTNDSWNQRFNVSSERGRKFGYINRHQSIEQPSQILVLKLWYTDVEKSKVLWLLLRYTNSTSYYNVVHTYITSRLWSPKG